MKSHAKTLLLPLENGTHSSSTPQATVPFQLPRVDRATRSRPGPQLAEPSTFLDAPGPPDSNAEIRHDLIGRVRREIEAGTYESPDKIDAVLDALAARMETV